MVVELLFTAWAVIGQYLPLSRVSCDAISPARSFDAKVSSMADSAASDIRSFAQRRHRITGGEVVSERQLGGPDTWLTMLEPARPGIVLPDWIRHHRDELITSLHKTGGLLFRGFGVDGPESFEQLALQFVPELFAENGEHPRTAVSGNVYTPVFFPPEERLLWHNENSFNAAGPAKIWFCAVRPADRGGETPVVDSRAVYRRLPASLRRPFEEKGVMYVRTYRTGLGLRWQDVFRTEDRAAVEARCQAEGMTYSWFGDDLRTTCVRPAVIRHPVTGEASWFNQAQHWHMSCLSEQTRQGLRKIFEPDQMPRDCFYGDGTPIPDEVMAAILEVYTELELAFPWQAGDVMMLDNILMAHGRNPFAGERRLLVVMGEMVPFR